MKAIVGAAWDENKSDEDRKKNLTVLVAEQKLPHIREFRAAWDRVHAEIDTDKVKST